MAHIWTKSNFGEWQPMALAGDAYVLAIGGPAPLAAARVPQAADPSFLDVAPDAPADAADTVLLRRVSAASDETWALLAGPAARPLVNGLPAPHGIVILSDRDEIRWAPPHDQPSRSADPIFFSTERLATVTPYPAGGRLGSCPRCKQPLAAGDASVRCPGCNLWHHATDALPCWTYGERCAACQQLTSLDAGFQWTPEDL